MSVYVGIDVHRKRSQVAVVAEDGKVQLNRNVVNGSEPMLRLIRGLQAWTPVAFEAAYGWGWTALIRSATLDTSASSRIGKLPRHCGSRDARRRAHLAPFYEGTCQGHGPGAVEGAAALVGVNVVRPAGRSTPSPRARRRVAAAAGAMGCGAERGGGSVRSAGPGSG